MKIYYINLSKRTDRRKLLEDELVKTGLEYERFEAIENSCGYLGCSQSHLEVLKLAKKNHLANVIILEDDFTFLIPPEKVNDKLKEFFNLGLDYDVVLLSYNIITHSNQCGPVVGKVIDSQTASGYLVNEKYYDTLIQNFEQGVNNLKINILDRRFCVDIHWKQLQPVDKWYYFIERIGKQRASFSDIEKCNVSYNC